MASQPQYYYYQPQPSNPAYQPQPQQQQQQQQAQPMYQYQQYPTTTYVSNPSGQSYPYASQSSPISPALQASYSISGSVDSWNREVSQAMTPTYTLPPILSANASQSQSKGSGDVTGYVRQLDLLFECRDQQKEKARKASKSKR